MLTSLPVFRPWAPTWLVRGALFLGLAPGFILLGLYAGNLGEAAAYFGFKLTDLQFSILLYFVGIVAYFPLDARVGAYLPVRRYYALAVALMLLSVWLCTLTTSLPGFLALRFLQGMLTVGVCSPCLGLIFSQLEPGQARPVGFSVFYGTLLCSTPLTTIIATYSLQHFSFSTLFYVFALLQLPGGLLLFLLLTNNRLQPRKPLYQVEWLSFGLYAASLGIGAYLVVYRQSLQWLEDGKPWLLLGILALLVVVFVRRQRSRKRPFLHLSVFRCRHFVLGLLLFMVLYLVRSSAAVASLYLSQVLRVDADQLAGLQVALLLGIVAGVSAALRLVLAGTALRTLMLVGFGLLLVHHGWLYSLFGAPHTPAEFVLPLLVQGLGNGFVFLPVVLFTLSPLSPKQVPTGVSLAVGARFLGFAASVALTNFLQSWLRATYDDQGSLSVGPATPQLAPHSLSSAPDTLSLLRFSSGYFALIGCVLTGLLLVLLLVPPLHRQYTFRKYQL
jgi:DHA2 family multidrug resistance protein